MQDIRLTVAAIIEHNERFLIVEEKDSSGNTVYNQPAGHVEPNESIPDAIKREVFEETGLDFTPEHLLGSYFLSPATNGKHYFRFCFIGSVKDVNALAPQDDDIIAAHWMTLDDIINLGRQLRSALVLQCLDDYRNGQRYSLDQFHFCANELAMAELCYTRLPKK
ncbi:NUDIX hydrolase [Pleionea sediminis]|uniref:NUDIX hydrolase n=1 Tax=Pleionea sediminis TaxID=2569479 RepID=UPI001185B235|nr:NUDIX hydrolase [Pleionea sediminis]